MTDRTDRKTYIAQGWVVTDPQALADVGPVPEGEAIIEIPEDVLKFSLSEYQEGRPLSLLDDDEFGQLFRTFQHTAFRPEARDQYKSANETEAFCRFVADEPVDLGWFQSWLTMIREAIAAGKHFRRVRVVSLPLTDYSRFGVFCAQFTNDAGEDIRYLERDRADAEGLPHHDYWLFDSRTLVWMHFDDTDRCLGCEVIEDPTVIVQHNYWRDAAWHHAVRRDDFAAK